MEGTSNFWPAMAVPMTVKIPEPITAPMPRAVRDQGPRVFFKECPGSSESRINLSLDLRATSCLSRAILLNPRRRRERVKLRLLPGNGGPGGLPVQDAFDAVYKVRLSQRNSSPFRSGPRGRRRRRQPPGENEYRASGRARIRSPGRSPVVLAVLGLSAWRCRGPVS